LILVVDDNYDIAWPIKISLEKAGLRASFFTDPLIALDEFRSHSTDYDLMVSDIRMPAMDGCELAQKIKKIKPDVKILLMSAYEFDCSDRCFTKAFLHSVVAGFIEKPISLDKLRTIIRTVLNNTKLSTGIMSTFYNNSVHVYSGNIAKKRTDFLICNKCLWFVSLYKYGHV
jgi:DNA-binding NtrC family response regulator